VLVLAGAAAAVAYFAMRGEDPQPLTEAEARTRLAASLQAAGDALSGQATDGDLRQITIAVDQDGSPASAGDFFGGIGKMGATIDYGKADRVRFALHLTSGAVTVDFSMICTPERQYMIAGGETYASRPVVAPDPEGEAGLRDCNQFSEDGFDEGVPPLEELEAEDAELDRHPDGSLTATMDDEEGQYVIEIGADGKVRTISATMEEDGHRMTMVMTYLYGARSTIDVPSEFTLVPATVDLSEESTATSKTWTVESSPEEPPLEDFEVRVQDYQVEYEYDEAWDESDRVAGVFALDSGRRQVSGNVTFTFTDADGDGKLSAGDSFVVEDRSVEQPTAQEMGWQEDQADEYSEYYGDRGYSYFPYGAVLYDNVADGEVNSGYQSMPSPLWLTLAGLGVAGLLLQRRR
jgi:hypothetical protein